MHVLQATKADLVALEGKLQLNSKDLEMAIQNGQQQLEAKLNNVEAKLEMKIQNVLQQMELQSKDMTAEQRMMARNLQILGFALSGLTLMNSDIAKALFAKYVPGVLGT